MQNREDGTCYLCIRLHDDYSKKLFREEHHVCFGTANRKLSERYGLKVYLCHTHHEHDGGPEAVHRSQAVRLLLCQDAQEAFEKRFPSLDFRGIFGKNYLTDRKEEKPKSKEFGFKRLESGSL